MKITGVTIIKNAVLNDYPVVEAITSVLPVVDEMIVSIDRGEDETDALIKAIDSDKIKIIYSEWDMNLRKGGVVLAVETNKALEHVSHDTDWIFYIQGDEVIHEKYHSAILQAATNYLPNLKIEGLLFNYLHFYGTYNYVGDSRKWYNKEVRIIRNDKNIKAYKDAQGFRKKNKKIKVAPINAYVYHYGWVKSPAQMAAKQKNVSRYWNEETEGWKNYVNSNDVFNFDNFDSLKKFTGTHPRVMQKRVSEKNWDIEIDISVKKFKLKGRILYWFEKKTGMRPFDFKNYKII
jgi:hypothetical protein